MFQFPAFAFLINQKWYRFTVPGCPIRKSADQSVCARPHSLSQLITSFFASESLGIPHTPFSTFSYVFILTLSLCVDVYMCLGVYVLMCLSTRTQKSQNSKQNPNSKQHNKIMYSVVFYSYSMSKNFAPVIAHSPKRVAHSSLTPVHPAM